MVLTKFGHSCVLIEEGGARILFDPGSYSEGRQNGLTNLDAILITHEHGDHIDIESVKALTAGNPGVKIFTNPTVKEILAKEGIEVQVLGDGESAEVKGVKIEGIGTTHAEIHSSVPRIKNTGYAISSSTVERERGMGIDSHSRTSDDRNKKSSPMTFYYPGDALTLPNRPVEILGMPTAAPWARFSELIDYTLTIKPKVVIPMHDGILARPAMFHPYLTKILGDAGVEFKPVEVGSEYSL
jgi:L-ascorbate metabolism protein UlaG (beta-lactamase superfamily)